MSYCSTEAWICSVRVSVISTQADVPALISEGTSNILFCVCLSVPHPSDSRVCKGYDGSVTGLLGCSFNGILKA